MIRRLLSRLQILWPQTRHHRRRKMPVAASQPGPPPTCCATAAMTLLQAGVDTAVIAIWLGHADIRSTHTHLHADLTIKQRALDRTTPATNPPGRFKPADSLLAFLEAPPCNYADTTTPVRTRTPSSPAIPDDHDRRFLRDARARASP